jgi:hypothetical protein
MIEGSRHRGAMTAAQLVATYIHAKDSNRPHLMRAAFAPDATLAMIVKTQGISFPPGASGLEAITEVLVSRFGRTYENIYTFCLCPAPDARESTFSCPWLVGMSERDGGAVRVGHGRYDWEFRPAGNGPVIGRLGITIEHMQVLRAERLEVVMDWLGRLPYPWCPMEAAIESIPAIEELASLSGGLRRQANAG